MSKARNPKQKRPQNREPLPPPTQDAGVRFVILFLINAVIAMIWPIFLPIFGALDYVIGYLAGLVFLMLIESSYGRQNLYAFSFILYVIGQIIQSNVSLAWTTIQPPQRMQERLHPAIVGVPLTVTSDLEIAILASVITLTPGTLSLDLSPDRSILYVHNLNLRDPESFRREVKEGFERRLLQVTRGGA